MEYKQRDVTKLKNQKTKGILQNGIQNKWMLQNGTQTKGCYKIKKKQRDITKWNTTRCYKMEYNKMLQNGIQTKGC